MGAGFGKGTEPVNSLTAARLAWSIWALCLPLITVGGLMSFLTVAGEFGPGSGVVVLLGALLLTFPTVGALVASRRPENPIGWIFCVAGFVFGVGILAEAYANYALHVSSAPVSGARFAAWLSSWTGPGLLLAAAFLFLLFPDGRLPSRRWRPVAWIVIIGSSLNALGVAFGPGPLEAHRSIANPVGIAGPLGGVVEVLGFAGAVVINVGVLLSGVSLVVRLIRARGVERQQLKWFVYSALMMGCGFAASILFRSGPANSIAWTLGILGFLVLPVATGIALLRYRLYDIDRIINRTLVYGALTAVLVAVYLGIVVTLRGLVFGFTGGSSQLVVVASTLAIAALFNPLRTRIQSFIDRRFYRRKYDAARTLEAFGARLRDDTDLDELNGDLVSVVRETMQPEHASLWLREHDGEARPS